MTQRIEAQGYAIARDLVPREVVDRAVSSLIDVVERLTGIRFLSVDDAWNHIRRTDRKLGSLLYNSAKLLPAIHRIAVDPSCLRYLPELGVIEPVIADINFRIDSLAEEKFLFDWHQDYWFSVCSPAAIVAWIPLMPIDAETGGVELVPRNVTGGRILRAKKGTSYNSYADAVVMDDDVPDGERLRCILDPGDVLFFRFDVLHRSLPVKSKDRSRWTLQIRYADLADEEFRRRNFKPGSVQSGDAPYFRELK